MENVRKEAAPGYFSHPSSASTSSGRRPETPGTVNQTARGMAQHARQNPSIDGLTMGSLPPGSPVIRIIYTGGQTKVINVKHCRSPDEVMLTVLKKLGLPETHYKNYCFYVLDGLDPQPSNCRRVSDSELMKISEGKRSERNRLILRKINDGDPELEEVKRAAQFAVDESLTLHNTALGSNSMRNQLKLQKLTGEPWHNITQPMSPASVMDRNRNIMTTADELERPETANSKTGQASSSKLRSFFGARPPSEMIMHDMTSYFPSHQREDIERTMRLSVRRSQRMSKAASRISVMSSASWASSMKDAPPIPSIADAWLAQSGQPIRASRPLSVSKFALPQMTFRDSIISTSLQPLAEESPIEPNRKSYVSFDSGSDSANQTLNDQDAHKSYFDETLSVAETGSSLQERLSMLVAEDGEEEDAGLNSFLSGNSFDNTNWIKGSLIGEGSFGSVSLALHAVTGELMAVKQVELPSIQHGTDVDKKKNAMIQALKHEIDLLQGMQHPNIVQYLGTSQDDSYLNIFLEYVAGGSIAVMLKQYNTFPEPLVRNFVRQILEGLAYLHGKNIIHRDIKGANVLVDNKGSIKISDFGISKRVEASSMLGVSGGGINRPSLQGSVFWMAPEVVRQSAHTKKADIWSLGCLIVEMFSGAHPFPDKTQLQAIFAIGSTQAKPQIPETCSDNAKKFLEKTFEIDHEKRPSAEELLKEVFLLPMA
ncbi:putative map kinase kinase kinase ste11 [Phaeomoniella chlamydospora]|uniref:Putative map kinase kinase kinase ste11 n=1 Tax=Phaeomoniella chlamydospora TaxID=158046 RepID=A0A0G2EQD4_PHACM|nr:putative map kinase kinase kinase ste11 [Phaeomoniella chlamydospora]